MRLLISLIFLLNTLGRCLAQPVPVKLLKPNVEYEKEVILPNGITFNEHVKIWHSEFFQESYWRNLQKSIGFVFPTDSLIDQTKKNDKGDGFHVHYKTDNLGLRQMPQVSKKQRHHLLLAGDSNTFGFGVSDNACSVFLISKKHPDYQAYNFGHGGGGPNNTLALMESYPWAEHIGQGDGKMIYLFYYEWMMPRVVGSKNFIRTEFGGGNPWYELNEKKEIYRAGIFNERTSSKFYKLINYIDRRNWVGDLPRKSVEDNQLTAKIFLKMKSLYLKKFPKGEFTVALSLYNVSEKNYVFELEQELKKLDVKVVLVHQDLHDVPQYHLLDWHFNERGQDFVANSLMEKIKF